MLISALVAIVVATFLWAAYRTVEQTLIRGGTARAVSSSHQLAESLSGSIPQLLTSTRRLGADPRILAFIRNPGPETADAIRTVLVNGSTPQLVRRFEIWSTDGRLLLEIASERTGEAAGLRTYPPGQRPVKPGISELKAAGEFAFVEIDAEIHEGSSSGPLVGYFRRFGEISSNTLLNRLLGDEAQLKVGTPGGIWSDFSVVVPPPPAGGSGAPGEYADEHGMRWIGAMEKIDGVPWSVWIGYPRPVVVAPAQAFLQRMTLIAFLVVAVGAVLARVVAARITRPLGALSSAAEKIAAGDYSGRVSIPRQDEIGRLGDAFNAMTVKLERDLAGREAAENALREREGSFRALFASNPLAMWVYDSNTLQFLEVNGVAIERYGYSRDEFLAMRITDIRPEEDIPRLIADLANPRQPWTHTRGWRHRLKSGQIIDVEVFSHVLTYGGHSAVLVVVQDVTERRRIEAQFLQSQKMEAIGQLTGGVAHDFNNLLTAILGYCDLLADALPAGTQGRADLQEIRKAGESAASLTSRLLSFSRKQIIEPKVLDLNAIVTETGRMLERIVGEDIAIELRLGADLGRVRADLGQIQQVLVNLVVNARDAMPAGGKLTIETDNIYLDEPYANTHLATTPGDYVVLVVSDTGVGMPPEVQAHVFEPFFTTKQAGKGSGLGLASVYGIVKQSGGSIWIYSEPGHGSTFKIYLPRLDAPLTVTAPPSGQVDAGSTATILVVEDNDAILSLTRRILEGAGFTLLSAASGAEALRTAEVHRRPIDLLLSDVIMPEQSGPALSIELQAMHPEMRVLYMSGYTDDAIVRHGIIESTTAFIQKPFSPDALLTKVRAVLAEPSPGQSPA